ncbi:MAG TPA: hypothetical protein VJ835_04115 [Fimbriimonadaceae bacterium]|nr:hypothetical protein [Fimbriimonadaceae bacterium]
MNLRNSKSYFVESESDSKFFDLCLTMKQVQDPTRNFAAVTEISTEWGKFLESSLNLGPESELRGFDLVGFKPRFMDRAVVVPEFLNYQKVFIESRDVMPASTITYGVVGKHLLLQLQEDYSVIRIHPRLCILTSDEIFAGFLAVDFLDWVKRG